LSVCLLGSAAQFGVSFLYFAVSVSQSLEVVSLSFGSVSQLSPVKFQFTSSVSFAVKLYYDQLSVQLNIVHSVISVCCQTGLFNASY